jgi:hypothetical protein
MAGEVGLAIQSFHSASKKKLAANSWTKKFVDKKIRANSCKFVDKKMIGNHSAQKWIENLGILRTFAD